MPVTWEANPARRNSRLTRYLHSHGDTMHNGTHCLHKVQQGRLNSEYPLKTCITHQEYSQAMQRDRLQKSRCRRDPCKLRALRSTGTRARPIYRPADFNRPIIAFLKSIGQKDADYNRFFFILFFFYKCYCA